MKLNASMKRLAIVRKAEEQADPEVEAAQATVIDNFKSSVAYLYKNTDLFGSAKDISVPPIRYTPSPNVCAAAA
jgi:hypothetical protein